MKKVKVSSRGGSEWPLYGTDGSAGADLFASNEDPIVLKSKGCRELIPTGLYFQIPKGYELQIRPRSGLAVKHGVTVLNTPGTIDSDYRGEVKIVLINHDPSKSFTVRRGDRVAQCVLVKCEKARFTPVMHLTTTKRGVGGFGSTGK